MAHATCSAEGCVASTVMARGMCAYHYLRWYKRHPGAAKAITVRPLIERLWEGLRVNMESGCWEWQAVRGADGYGRLGVRGATVLTHRAMYQLLIGPIPPGLHIDHLCRNRSCCNPFHLDACTHQVNTARSHGNGSKTHCKNGHEFTPENTYRAPNTHVRRDCRVCRREAMARLRERRKAARVRNL